MAWACRQLKIKRTVPALGFFRSSDECSKISTTSWMRISDK